MSNVINQNLDEIISIKNQLSNVLIENGVEAGNRFSDYPDMFRSVIASGGSFNPAYYYTIDEIDENFVSYSYATANFVSYSYLAEALAEIDVDVDLDDYVTYSYAYNTFVSYAYLGDLEQISEYILGSGSSSAPENVYATKVELGSYVSKSELDSMSYATQSYVMDKIGAIPSVDLSSYVTDTQLQSYLSSYVTHTELNNAGYVTSTALENASYITTGYISTHDIVPADDGFYQLGNAAYKYLQVSSNLIFTDEVAFGRGGIKYDDVSKDSVQIYTSSTNRININSDGIIPAYTNTYTLGDTDHFYARTYTCSIQSGSGGLAFRIGSSNTAVFGGGDFRPSTNEGQSLGRSTNRWNNTYTSKIYADTAYISNYNNLIWTGTSAQYATLPDYTTYQLYLIQEA